MQTEQAKVISIFSKRKKAIAENASKDAKGEGSEEFEELFSNTIEENMKTKDRLASDRKKANKSVIRSYRLKK